VKNKLLTTEGIRAAEEIAISEGLSIETLMENAGHAVAELIFKEFSPCPVLILAGPGKNGGDAKVVARLLKAQKWPVEILSLSHLPSFDKVQESIDKAQLIVDGLFGIGLDRPLEGDTLKLIELVNHSRKPVVAIDMPSGIEANSGAVCEEAIQALYTVTFLRAKPGHYLLPGRLHTGKLIIRDIDVPEGIISPTPYYLNAPSLWIDSIKEPQPSDHKYTRGACVIMGNGSMPGAVKLAALAARRVGAGLVRLTCKAEDYPIFAGSTWGDIITPLASAKSFIDLVKDDHFNALLWGTGAFPTESTRQQAILLLALKKACVLDGGALSSFEGRALELTGHLHENVILTPHEGEFIRLFPHLAFLNNKAEKALKAAAEVGATIVLKGYDTIIASPQGEVIINANAPATLATAGTGDVLAGLMAGLLAQGVPPFKAAAAAVWIHGECASRIGIGLIVEDLLGEIPGVLQFLSVLKKEII
jgi:hydroxyethylthiazole kinase-like uncharacterized protein yjeF